MKCISITQWVCEKCVGEVKEQIEELRQAKEPQPSDELDDVIRNHPFTVQFTDGKREVVDYLSDHCNGRYLDELAQAVREWLNEKMPKEHWCDYHDYRKSKVNCGTCRDSETYNIALEDVKSALGIGGTE